MNTRQKLTLGIAAIFMVTLTIIGVTYAYFVTRVTGSATENTVEVSTATLATVKYVDNGDIVEFDNVMPGVIKYKSFSVSNKSEDASKPVTAAGAYNIFLTNTDGTKKFVQSALTDTLNATCYTKDAADKAAGVDNGANIDACYGATAYNNIYVTLYRVASNPNEGEGKTSDEVDASTAETLIASALETVKAETNLAVTTDDTQTLTAKTVEIPAETVYHYILKVEYRSVDANQSIEQGANVKIKVDIA